MAVSVFILSENRKGCGEKILKVLTYPTLPLVSRAPALIRAQDVPFNLKEYWQHMSFSMREPDIQEQLSK